ncbi:MAG: c-type cytochrome biogenesis protein CcmI [Alphaproteobacteria bacterium]|jgi:cytochrome c-type biogenesis protein CcmH|nr:c-type cytochrome biogenesis protein CcmI [Alphaproteobacteria bacterium]MDP6589001.1 c-type cytochrome biogenesis protein CcmI [Alphaproteobacteria bacterium]MDP6816984.1 c-type cytochrome biogenesis protein CcmI [Alphaproteobacteria bacterium]
MIFWLVAALMTVAALALVLVPLLRSHRRAPRRVEFDMAIYRDQLNELESDLSRGLVGEDQSEAARVEIQRRMLAAARRGGGESPAPEGAEEAPAAPADKARNRLLMGAMAVAIPALAVALYLILGAPGTPGQPFSGVAQQGGGATTQAMGDQSMDATIANLARRLEQEPGDVQGWLLLGRSLLSVQRYGESAQAFATAAKLSGGDPEVNSMMAEAMVLAAGGVVTPDAEAAFETVLGARPDDAAAQYYIGKALAQRGRPVEALEVWRKLAAETPLDVPWRPDLVAMMERAAEEADMDLGEIPFAAPATAQPPGPSQEDMAAAAEMSPDEQLEMIRSMVGRLAARLAEEPDDLEGWRNLARSYRVLGEDAKAAEAERRVAELEGGTDGAPGESAEEQAQKVGAMVERLAERLRENPGDLQGWLNLGRSYSVLGRHAEANNAFEWALQLAPDDTAVLNDYARAVLNASDDTERFPEQAIRLFRRILELDPDHLEAIWFMGYVEAGSGRPEAARGYWQHLIELLPADGGDREAVQQAIDSLRN